MDFKIEKVNIYFYFFSFWEFGISFGAKLISWNQVQNV
jgi:hypothetical protein